MTRGSGGDDRRLTLIARSLEGTPPRGAGLNITLLALLALVLAAAVALIVQIGF